jgi:vitellogenic carboxypeptidase-like protein
MNALVDKSKESELSFIDFVQTPEIRSALHVGNLSYDFESASVVEKFELDFMGSMKHLVQDLLNQNIPILMITGQMDTTLPHRGVQNMISKLDWKRRSEYEASERKVWKVEDRVAGFERSGGGLTSVLVRNAGHGLIGDQKVWIVNMLNRITGNKTN